jgi:hypothetical protein
VSYSKSSPYNTFTDFVPPCQYVPPVENESPILPVCHNKVRSLSGVNDEAICMCGDEFGDMTAAFAMAVNLKPTAPDGSEDKESEWSYIRTCFKSLENLGRSQSAIYLSNACHSVYSIAAPPGTGSYLERKNRGAYRENLEACNVYWDIIERNKQLSKDELNHLICLAWGENARDFKRGWTKKHKKKYDMSLRTVD